MQYYWKSHWFIIRPFKATLPKLCTGFENCNSCSFISIGMFKAIPFCAICPPGNTMGFIKTGIKLRSRFMPPPFEEWWRGIKCYPCPCVRPLSKFGVRSITFERLQRFNSNLVCWYIISTHR